MLTQYRLQFDPPRERSFRPARLGKRVVRGQAGSIVTHYRTTWAHQAETERVSVFSPRPARSSLRQREYFEITRSLRDHGAAESQNHLTTGRHNRGWNVK